MTGLWPLVKLAIRRDRWLLPAWIIGLTLMVALSATATADLYPDEAALASAADTINATAALVALYGKVYDPTSLGALSLIKLTAFGAALVGVVFAFVTVRHTRADEEAERMELVSAGAVDRAAPLAAALVVSIGASLLLGVTAALALGAAGLPWSGAFAFGAGWALSGAVFASLAAVAAQVMTTARAAVIVAVVGVGVAYALRAVGDLADGDPGWLSWLSPVGWSQQIRPFAGDRWTVVVLPVVTTCILAATAFVLRARRDLGAGLVPERPGPASGRLGLLGQAWRLQRGLFVAWVAATAALGFVLGSIAHNVTGLLDSPQMTQYLAVLGGEQGLIDMFLAAEVAITGAVITAYGIAAGLRLRTEEASGHVELLLSARADRVRWALTHTVIALGGTAVLMVLAGSAIGLGHGLSVGDPLGQTARVASAAVAHIPAALAVASTVVVLFGVLPRAAVAAWGVLAVAVALGELGPLWQLPQWVLDLSPFAHSPHLPGGDVEWLPLAVMLAIAAALVAVGLARWRGRDLVA